MKRAQVPECYRTDEWHALCRGVALSGHAPVNALVAADWLEEHGQEDHAHFIRAAVEIGAGSKEDPAPYSEEIRQFRLPYELGYALQRWRSLSPGPHLTFNRRGRSGGKSRPTALSPRFVFVNGFPDGNQSVVFLDSVRHELAAFLTVFPMRPAVALSPTDPLVPGGLIMIGRGGACVVGGGGHAATIPPRIFDLMPCEYPVGEFLSYTTAKQAMAAVEAAAIAWLNRAAGRDVCLSDGSQSDPPDREKSSK